MADNALMYKDDNMKPGKFYIPYVNLDQATALILAPPFNVNFEDSTFVSIQLETSHSIEIWQIEKFGEHEKHTNITNSVDWYILHPQNMLIINSNKPISGYVKFI